MNPRILTPGRAYAAVIVLATFWVVHGFVHSLLAAAIIAIASWPLYRRWTAWLPQRWRGSPAAASFTVALTAFVLAPMLFAAWALLSEAQGIVREVIAADRHGIAVPAWLEGVPLIGPWASARWERELAHPGDLLAWAQHASPAAMVGWIQSLGRFAARHGLILLFAILLLFFAFREGEVLAADFRRLLRHAIGERAERYVDVVTRAVRASVASMVVVGLFDGVLMGLGLAVAGVARAAQWGAIVGALGAIPFLGYAAVGALAVRSAIEGQGAQAALSLALGCFVLLAGDKLLRPALAREGMRLPFVVVLMGCIGGFEVLGLEGLVIGPVVLALARELWDERVRRARRDVGGAMRDTESGRNADGSHTTSRMPLPIVNGMDSERHIATRAAPAPQRPRFARAFAAVLVAGAPLIAAAQAASDAAATEESAAAPDAAAVTTPARDDGFGLHTLLPSSVFLQAGSAAHVDTVSIGVIWPLPWERDYSFGRLATSIEASFGEWQTHGQRHHTRPFSQVGFTPTLRFYPDAWHGRWFVEAGIGANVIAPAYHTDGKRFSTEFNFGDHIGIGREFGASHRQEVSLRIEHFSNAGIDHPNPGENFVQLRWVVRR